MSSGASGPKRSPREFLRARRPELFSDTRNKTRTAITPAALDYQLATLTGRNQERDFEKVCFYIAGKTLCPRLQPQSGPTGGGDSGADAVSYPVAESLEATIFIGFPDQNRQRKWGFAFSAKKAWRGKAKSDVLKIASLPEGIELIYFVSSQVIPDKARSQVERELGQQTRKEVHLLDRNWLVEKTFEHDITEAVAERLGMASSQVSYVEQGPLDQERLHRLAALREQIAGAVDPPPWTLVEWHLDAALTCRGLDRPRNEVDGYFQRAYDLAVAGGLTADAFRVLYNRAWTSYWWFGDVAVLQTCYAEMEEMVSTLGCRQVEDLWALWHLLLNAEQDRLIAPDQAQLDKRRRRIVDALAKLEEEFGNKVAGLQSRALLCLVGIDERFRRGEDTQPEFQKLASAVSAGSNVALFPVGRFVQWLEGIGEFLGPESGFERAFEAVLKVAARQEGELSEGRMLLTRGKQHLQGNRYPECLSTLRRALQNLTKVEAHNELIDCLLLIGVAYSNLGLFWAARIQFGWVAYLAMQGRAVGELPDEEGLLGVANMFSTELALGRVTNAVMWMQIQNALARTAGIDPLEAPTREHHLLQDGLLANLLLRVPFDELEALRSLPDALSGRGLLISHQAILFALGEEDVLRDLCFKDEPNPNFDTFFGQLSEMPGADDVPPRPILPLGPRQLYETWLLGCNILVDLPCHPATVSVAEGLLATIERLSSNWSLEQAVSFRSSVRVRIELGDKAFLAEVLPSKDGAEIPISVPAHLGYSLDSVDVENLERWFLSTAAAIFVSTISGFHKTFRELFKESAKDGGAAPGLSPHYRFSEIITPPFPLIADLLDDDTRKYSLNRSAAWSPPRSPNDRSVRKGVMRHRDFRVDDLIQPDEWDRAVWVGTFFQVGGGMAPLLGLCFENREAGDRIFSRWQSMLGDSDPDDHLSVSIVHSLPEEEPSTYAMVVGPVGNRITTGRVILHGQRIHFMHPDKDSRNLERFLAAFEEHRQFLLVPSYGRRNLVQEPPNRLGIRKRKLRVLAAADVTDKDPEQVVLQAPSTRERPPRKKQS